MDPGSPTGLGAIDDPSGGVERLSEATGVAFEHLQAARDQTARRTAEVTAALARAGSRDGLSTCVFGSWAREELTAESDDDWAVLVARPFAAYDPDVLAEIVAAQAQLGAGDRRPGTQGVFGEPICVPDLAARIGLDADTNTNFTRRMLLLLESRELHGDVRRSAVEQILGRYLYESHTAGQPPRFLLNDVVRYWRTICVDFEGKAAGSAGARDPKWASRNAKLRTSRKLLFAGGLVPVLLCHLCEPAATAGFLSRWFDASPLDRVSTAFLFVGLPDSGVRALAAYDRWIGLMAQPDVRAELDTLTVEARDLSPLYAEIRDIGRAFEDALGALLFSSRLGPLTRTYAIF
ncbi:MAG TPA: hypothetical protein VI300_17505 [Solirubrobacter sp.]